ncbi:hypothetical protein KDX23_28255 [Burkholderia vietnamiensis]|uniref:HEPN domain-containing protein n=1 Tax=Burkholderia vietnamiensis TaxID=60552 RepID=UPI001BA03567|nr:HEPN domain-containing protein [Burkholderia vietnamiensis]MBR8086628.1 hypothetical protein [Burkholderia vietnamiensis]
MKNEITIDKNAVARAVRTPLEAYYKAVADTGYDGSTERPADWEMNEELGRAIARSKYVSKHLDWFYVVELAYVVLDSHPPLKPTEFAEELEKLIVATASHRDYLAIFPLSFRPAMNFSFPRARKSVVKSRAIGKFNVSPAIPSSKALNKIVAKHGFPLIDEPSFQHAMRTSNGAFSRDMVVTFDIHGAEDQLRWNADIEFTFFRRLIEVFGSLFGDGRSGFGSGISVNHFFLLNKVNGDLRRLPTRAPSFVDLPLSAALFQAIGRPAFNDFLSKVSSSRETMYGRLRNAIKFFSMALSADDDVASFLFYVVAMESIFSRDKNNPIKVTLADLGAMLCFPPAQRLKAHERIRKAYDLRSSIVHSGVSSVRRKDVDMARALAARAIYASLALCHQLENEEGKLEDRFFNHLRDQKLGLVKATAPRELWALPEPTNDGDDE